MKRNQSNARSVALNPTTILSLAVVFLIGCGTTTKRIATEQLLISDAVDQTVSEIDFSCLSDLDVYIDTTYMRDVKTSGIVSADYIISAIRQQLATAGCRIRDERADATVIIEPRVGALGTDGHEVTYGIPQTGQFSAAAAAMSASPLVPALPEISFGRSDEQLGVAKIVLFAYDRETRVALWQSGIRKSESSSSNTWVLGAGPFQKGSIHEGYRFAGRRFGDQKNDFGDQKILADIDAVTEQLDKQEEPAERIADESKNADTDDTSLIR